MRRESRPAPGPELRHARSASVAAGSSRYRVAGSSPVTQLTVLSPPAMRNRVHKRPDRCNAYAHVQNPARPPVLSCGRSVEACRMAVAVNVADPGNPGCSAAGQRGAGACRRARCRSGEPWHLLPAHVTRAAVDDARRPCAAGFHRPAAGLRLRRLSRRPAQRSRGTPRPCAASCLSQAMLGTRRLRAAGTWRAGFRAGPGG